MAIVLSTQATIPCAETVALSIGCSSHTGAEEWLPNAYVLDDSLNGIGRIDRLNCGHVFFLPTVVVSLCCMFDFVLSNFVSFSGRIDNLICLHGCYEFEQVIYL